MGIEGARARARRTESFFFSSCSGGVGEKVFYQPHQNATPCTTTSWGNSLVSFRSNPPVQQVIGTGQAFFSFLNCPFHFSFFPSFLLCNDTVSSDGQNVQQARKQYQRIVHPYSIRQIWLKSFRSSVVSNQWNRPNNKKKIDTATDNKRRRRLDLTVTVILALLF